LTKPRPCTRPAASRISTSSPLSKPPSTATTPIRKKRGLAHSNAMQRALVDPSAPFATRNCDVAPRAPATRLAQSACPRRRPARILSSSPHASVGNDHRVPSAVASRAASNLLPCAGPHWSAGGARQGLFIDGRQLGHSLGVGVERRIGRVQPVQLLSMSSRSASNATARRATGPSSVSEDRLGGLAALSPPVLDQLAPRCTIVFVSTGDGSQSAAHQGVRRQSAGPIGQIS